MSISDQTPGRPFDLVIFGATGFTGGLTADYLAAHLPADARWALAGRSQAKLEAVRDRLAAINPAAATLQLLLADTNDPESLRAVAESARVVIATVGPYLEHGEPLVAACAAAGTDYLDLTGEPEFIDRMYLNHHATAVQSGARLVHACGFDSIPHDLGAFFTVQQLPDGVPLRVRGVVRSKMMISGGTLHSALAQMSRLRQMRQAAVARKKAEPQTDARRTRIRAGVPHQDSTLGVWLLPLPTVDPQIVQRSAAARSDYGPDFTYTHYAGLRRATTLAAALAGVGAFVAAAQVPRLRRVLGRRIPQGEGPAESQRASSWFTVDFIGEGGGKQVHTQVRGGDPGYGETAKMLAESAMCLAFDANPPTSGQLTTVAAMGEKLLRRLIDAGISFRVLEETTSKAPDPFVPPDTAEALSGLTMPLAEAMRSQRAIRRLRFDPVDEDLLREVLALALKAPTSSNSQDWAFVVVNDAEQKRRLVRSYQRISKLLNGFARRATTDEAMRRQLKVSEWQGEHLHEMPTLVVACYRRTPKHQPVGWPQIRVTSFYGSVYPAVQNLLLACRAVGLGASLQTLPLWLVRNTRRVLELPPEMVPVCIIPIGWARGRYGPTQRPPIDEVVHVDRFGHQPWRSVQADEVGGDGP